MSDIKPITIYGLGRGPNPRKVLILCEELNIPYNAIPVDNPKEESFQKINPNGRIPAIEDPNTGITLWESGAIIEYLVETYDKEHKLTFTTEPEKWHLKQYLHFQMSGQGPYYGQVCHADDGAKHKLTVRKAYWFEKYHPEPVQSAKDRYAEQVARVIGVLDKILQGKEYLVGDKCGLFSTYADLAFIPWNLGAPSIGDLWEKYDIENKFPNYIAWQNRLMARPAVARIEAPDKKE
ncbi:hypothetical protein FZEAL_9508 [Fusarium zealandicum]|uniref:Glutathione S-transferase n=1 Tax=Fusarium zealandicum TaxID=1053134 RepID=A0A8H4UAG3_9HYPO|nr:hypothetical protein FZEAL_9508 [Fusarium zealandicum]